MSSDSTRRAQQRTGAGSVVLGYKLRLYPNAAKRWMLGALAAYFAREHAESLNRLSATHPQKPVTLRGLQQASTGEFKQRATRRAVLDLQRQRKALLKAKGRCPWPVPLPKLRARLIDAAEVQVPRRACSFDLWVHVEGLARWCQLYAPAKLHDGINRTLALPGAKLNTGAEIFERDGQWYARVSVTVPQPAVQETHGVIGADVGVRAAVTTSDGRVAPSLHPVLRRSRDQLATRQREQQTRRTNGLSQQRQRLCAEARRLVTLAEHTGRAVALENPSRLIRWKQHAARFFGQRVSLLGKLHGVPVVLVPPPYTSLTCSRCGGRATNRHRRMFHCWDCKLTVNADVNASRNIAHEGAAVFRAARSMSAHTSTPMAGVR